MPARDARVDAYIARSPEFARPLLEHFRAVVHDACPTVEETLKWGHPHFMHQGMLCGMAAFKEHCAVNFWKGSLIFPANEPKQAEAMGQLGRIRSLKDFPSRTALKAAVRRAVALNESGEKRPVRAPGTRKPLATPLDLVRALGRNSRARKIWDGFPPSHRRDYIEWITEAKRDETRARRLATTVEWLEEGKSRNWKYERK